MWAWTEYVFVGPKGERLTIQRLHQLVNLWCKAVGLQGHFGTHTLRKTFGYHARVYHGVDLALLMDIYRHASQATTLRYIGLRQEDRDKAHIGMNLG